MATKRVPPGLPVRAKQWIRMEIANMGRQEIYPKLFGIDMSDKAAVNRCDQQVHRWRTHPAYEREWQKAWREAWGKLTYQAMDVISEGMGDSNLPWRRTQSANVALTYGQKNLVGEDSGVVKVEVVGMPELGTPDGASGNGDD